MTIATKFTWHALRQAQRRGISHETLNLVLTHNDHSQGLPGRARALWVGRRGRNRLIQAGIPITKVERLSGVRLILDTLRDEVLTVEHCLKRRRWA
jgi:hypothetical protein